MNPYFRYGPIILTLFTLIPLAPANADIPATPTPGSVHESSRAVDNSGINRRDRTADARTATEQALSGDAQRVTQEIRAEIVKRKDLSLYAHNIKVITDTSGTVWLRGPVRSDAERTTIGEIAAAVAGGEKVRNEIEVSPKTVG